MKQFIHLSMVTLVTILLSVIAQAQTENALDFDGIDDQVEAFNASSLIAGSPQMSIACWVYPRNPAPTFPDFDGFIGFRDNLYADFYLLQYSATSIEARFTNSSGVQYNIISNGMQLNTWQHYAMTYDGSYLRVYHNGVITDSIPASGTINNSLQSFLVGNLLYQGTNYYLDGKVDEVGLWNRGLTSEEVMCLYKNKIDLNSNGLLMYFDMNTGVAGGNNTGIGVIPDKKLNVNGVLSGFNLTGTTSNFIDGIDNSTVITSILCVGQSYTYNGQFLSQPGTYTFTYTSSVNCDSTIKIILTQNDTSVTQNQNTLTASQSGATYQWIDCLNNTPVTGAINQSFTPTANGTYAVVIGANGCSDTSSCHSVIVSSVNSLSVANWQIYPNPASDVLTLISNHPAGNVDIVLSDITGKTIRKIQTDNPRYQLQLTGLSSGVYQLTVISTSEIINFKFLKL